MEQARYSGPLPADATPAPVPTVHAPGALSPDGAWRWDGLDWVPATARTASRPYRALGALPLLAMGGLALAGLTQLVTLGALTGRLDILGRISSGAGVTLDEATHSDDVVRAAGFIQLGATVVCAAAVITWLFRVVANNHALGARALRFGPGSAVGWWFVPFANWVMPFRVLAESWRAADPQHPYSTPDQRALAPLPAALSAWWVALAFGSVVAVIGNGVGGGSGADLDTLHTATVLFMVSTSLLAIAAVLGTVVVNLLSRRQDSQLAALSAAHAQTTPAI